MKPHRLVARKFSAMDRKFWRALSQIQLDTEVKTNDFHKATIATLLNENGNSTKVLTFPHQMILSSADDLQNVKSLMKGKIAMFTFDPSKLIDINRGIRTQNKKSAMNNGHRYFNFKMNEIEETMAHPSNIQSILNQFDMQKENPAELWRCFSDKLISEYDLRISNPNLRNSLLYLAMNTDAEEADYELSFGGFPEFCLKAKMAESIPREQLLSSHVNYVKLKTDFKLEQNYRPNNTIFFYKDMGNLRLVLNREFIRGKFIIELAREVMKKRQKDVVILTEPFFNNQLLQISKLRNFNDDSDTAQSNKAKMAKIEKEQKENLRNLKESADRENIDLGKFIKLDEINREDDDEEDEGDGADILDFSLEKLTSLKSLKNLKQSRIDDMLCKMATWEVHHDFEFDKPRNGSNDHFFIDQDADSFTSGEISELQSRYKIFYDCIYHSTYTIVKQMNACERAWTIEQVHDHIRENTGLNFEEITEYTR
jgi:hypothetical protein